MLTNYKYLIIDEGQPPRLANWIDEQTLERCGDCCCEVVNLNEGTFYYHKNGWKKVEERQKEHIPDFDDPDTGEVSENRRLK